ncbi:MAG TPA: hypothetical protein VL068_12750 [Microthrixaceae bacterium]|nr:hypothetical protein [Microthrixaceae bacterium]
MTDCDTKHHKHFAMDLVDDRVVPGTDTPRSDTSDQLLCGWGSRGDGE